MTPKSRCGMKLATIIVGWAVIVSGFLYWAFTDRATMAASVGQNTYDIGDHETRIRDVEHTLAKDIAEIKSDIRYLRKDAEEGR